MKVLSVENDPSVRDMAVPHPNRAGYEVVEAASGGQALELLHTRIAIDTLQTDIGLPATSGWEVARTCRERVPGCPSSSDGLWGVYAACARG